MSAKKVLFARVSKEAHAYAKSHVRRAKAKDPGFSASVFIDKLLLSYKKKRSHDKKHAAA